MRDHSKPTPPSCTRRRVKAVPAPAGAGCAKLGSAPRSIGTGAGHEPRTRAGAASPPRSSIRIARAAIEHGAMHKPLHLSVAYGYADARDLAAVFQGRKRRATPTAGRATRPAPRSRPRSRGWRTASRRVAFATGMAAIGAAMLSLLRAGDHVVASAFLFGNTVSLFNTLAAHGDRRQLRRRDRRRQRRARADAARRGWCSSRRSPTRARRWPTSRGIGALCAARGIVYVVDNTMTSPWLFRPKSVRREPRRQRADQVRRRARQRARRQHHRHRPLRLDALPEHRRRPTSRRAPALWGITQIRKKGLRDWGGTLARRAGAPHRRRRRDAGAADGAHLRQRAGARRVPRARTRRCARSTTPGCRRIRSTRGRRRCSAASAGCSRSSSSTASTASTC